MIIVYESKTGFTKKYAEMLSEKTGLGICSTKELSKAHEAEDIVFLGWISAGRIKGLNKVIGKFPVKAVCASGTGQKAEPDEDTFTKRNRIKGMPFFYLRGGCLPLSQIKGFDKLALSLFLKMLRSKKDPSYAEAISNIENGCDYVNEENLAPVIEWVKGRINRSADTN
ncbi:MAG: flavodoxin domain-containing protein [Clostridiales bacterium]|jgi:flavodoxin|nr:flavodoxin domain-containing protein [Clostridiales bacterium]